MKNLYEVYERMHFYHWQDDTIVNLIRILKEHHDLREFDEKAYWSFLGPFETTLYLLASLSFNSNKDEVIKFLEFLLQDEHTREVPQ